MIQNQWQVGKIMDAPNQQFPERKFKLIKQLGNGSEGVVFEAQSINWDQAQQKYALKIHYYQLSDRYIDFIDRLIDYQQKNEQPSIIQTNQSYIIRTYERFCNSQKQMVLVMELGTSDFYEYLKHSNLNLSQIRNYCIQITKAIYFIHSNGYIHRDLKHENFIIVGQDVKMIDFGQIKNQSELRMTQNVGSPIFQAPEVMFGGIDYKQSIDIWSLGCVIYETIKKESLFNFKTTEEVYKQLQQCMIDQDIIKQKITQLCISDQWKQTLQKMLQIKEENRPKIQDVLSELEKNQIDQRMNFLTQSTPVQNFKIPPSPFPNQFVPNQNSNISIQIKNLLTSLNNNTAKTYFQQNNQAKQDLEQLIQQSLNLLGISSNNIHQQQLDLDALGQNMNLQEKLDFVDKLIGQISLEEQNKIHMDLATKISELYGKKEALQFQQQQFLEMQETISKLTQQIESQNEKNQQSINLKKQYQELQAKVQALMNLEEQLQQSLKQLTSSFVSNEEQSDQQKQNQTSLEQRQIQIQNQQEKIFSLQQELNKAKVIEKIFQENQMTIAQLEKDLKEKKLLEETVYQQHFSIAQLKIQLKEIENLKAQSQQQQEEVDKLKNQIQSLQDSRVQFVETVFQKNELKSQLDFLENEMPKFSVIDSELQNLNDQLKNKQSELEEVKKKKEQSKQQNIEINQILVELEKQQIEQELQNQLIELRQKKIYNLTQEIEKLKQTLNKGGNQQQEKIDQLLAQKNDIQLLLQTQQLKQQKEKQNEQDLCLKTDGDIQYQQQQNNSLFNYQNQIKNQQFNVMQTEQVTSQKFQGFPNQKKGNF